MTIIPFPKIDLTDVTPRYYQMYLSLKERITSGEFGQKGMIPTERELCEQYNISRITVIKALDILETEGLIERQQGRGSFVKEINEKEPEHIKMTQMVAFVCGFLSHPFQASILVGLAGVLARNGISLQVFGSVDNSDTEVETLNEALAREVNGFIVLPWAGYQNTAFFQGLLAKGVPIVMVDRYYPNLCVDYVVHDGWRGGYELTTNLIQQGHKKIAFAISDEVLPTSVHDRLSGYRDALEKNGLPYDENLVWLNVTMPTQPWRKHITQDILEKEFYRHIITEHPTGLVAVNYDVAEFLRYNIFLGPLATHLPAEYLKTIAIASFCHYPKPIYAPNISSLAMQPGEPIGVAAAEIMVERLRKNDLSMQHQINLPMEIVDITAHQLITETDSSFSLLEK